MSAAIKKELAEALRDRVGLSPERARRAADTALRTLSSRAWVTRVAPRTVLVSARRLKRIRGRVTDRLDQPAFVSSLSKLLAVATGAPEQTLAATTDVLAWSAEPLRASTITRIVRALTEVLREAPREVFARAAAASSDLDALLTTLEAAEMVVSSGDTDIASARARGIEARRQLLAMEGGPWSVARVASHLRITRQGVDRRRHADKLLAVTSGKRGYLYPSWQFSHEGVLKGLEDVMAELAEHDPWSRVIFFLSPNSRLSGRSPLQALRVGQVDAVRRAAAAFGEHGAA